MIFFTLKMFNFLNGFLPYLLRRCTHTVFRQPTTKRKREKLKIQKVHEIAVCLAEM